MKPITRRALLAGGAVAGVAAAGAALTNVGRRFGLVPPDAQGFYGPGATLTYAAHRLFGRHALAREFPRSAIASKPFANEIAAPTPAFAQHQQDGFANWRLEVSGMVTTPLSLSVADLRAIEMRSQITAVTCEEGWSYVAEWTGTPVSAILAACGALPEAKYVVYSTLDPDWWDSIDIDEARHPQTLVAWSMNGETLPVPFGGPLRMRVPRQLGYKSVKFINKLVVTDTLEGIGDGTGAAGSGYAWYSGV